MSFKLTAIGYHQVKNLEGELLGRFSGQQTAITAAANAESDGENVIIHWAKWRVTPIDTQAPPDPIPNPDPVPTPDPTGRRAADTFAELQYDGWFKNRDKTDLNGWMYDTVQSLYELGQRTGRADILADAKASALEYIQDYDDGGPPNGVNWSGKSVLTKPIRNGDMKFTYVAPLYYLQTVEGIQADPALLSKLRDALWSMGWFGQSWNEDWTPWSYWNERAAGYSLMGLQYLARMEVPGAMEMVLKIIAWLHKFQDDNGFWMHSYFGHEGHDLDEEIGDSNDVLCASPWMSCIIGGALSRFNAVFPTAEATEVIRKLGAGQLAALQSADDPNYSSLPNGEQWMISYNHSGYGCRYFVFTDKRDGSPADPAWVKANQLNHWYSDKQNPEVWLCIEAAGLTPPADIALHFSDDMIRNVDKPQRLFNQNHSHYG